MNKLFQPGKIGSLTVKNRAVMPPMQVLYGELDGTPGPRCVKYYEERAKGGAGLIIVEATAVDNINNTPWDHQLLLTHDKYISSFAQLAEAIHRYDCLAFIQLHHYGSKSAPTAAGPAWTSSEIPALPGGKPGHKMTAEEIKIMQKRFIDAAVRAQKAGFDGVELAGTHGYLLHQFLSPYYNNRTDEYGGSTENRCRFYTELIQGIHAACGRSYPVSVRFPGDEFTPEVAGTMGVAEGVEIAKILEAAGADVLNVSNGNNFNANANCEPYSYRAGWKKHVAKAVHDAVSIPVMATNTIKDPEYADSLLEEGVSDFVCLGRALIADPFFMRKAKQGDVTGIRKCMGCMFCREQLYQVQPIRCALNPRAGCEYLYADTLPQDLQGSSAVVVGGGPAGMECAKAWAERGAKVTLFEQGSELGGSMNLADKGLFKEKITLARDTMAAQIERLGVEVRLNTAVTVEELKAMAPDKVALCVGAKPIIPNVPGLDPADVITSHQVIRGEKEVSGTVAVIGAGMTGLECAEQLCAKGCKVKIIDMQPAVGSGMFSVIVADLMSRIKPYAPEILTGKALTAITENGVQVKDAASGALEDVSADYVVLSLGVVPDTQLADAYREAFEDVLILGDARTSGRIPHAVKDAYIKASSI